MKRLTRSTWLNLLLGLWLMVSPLVIYFANRRALRVLWEDFLLGFGIAVFTFVRIVSRKKSEMVFADWFILTLGFLTLVNPILYRYTNAPIAKWNNLVVGTVVLALAVYQDWKDERTTRDHRGHAGS